MFWTNKFLWYRDLWQLQILLDEPNLWFFIGHPFWLLSISGVKRTCFLESRFVTFERTVCPCVRMWRGKVSFEYDIPLKMDWLMTPCFPPLSYATARDTISQCVQGREFLMRTCDMNARNSTILSCFNRCLCIDCASFFIKLEQWACHAAVVRY